jgi:hypothetical protein
LKKYIIAGVFLLGGVYFLRKLTKGELTKKTNADIQDFIQEEQGLIFGGKKCPIDKDTVEQQRKIREAWKKRDSLGYLMGGSKYTAPQYPFEWDELCTKEQISQFKTSLQDASKNLMEIANKGLMPPMLSPQAIINLAKQFGKGAGAFDPNKDYYTSCGTEMCWKWDGKRWIKK